MTEIEKRLAFLHGEFADWFRQRAPERFRTLAIVLHDGIRERIKELVPEPALGKALAAVDAEFEAATGFRFEPWGDEPPVAQEVPGGRAGVVQLTMVADDIETCECATDSVPGPIINGVKTTEVTGGVIKLRLRGGRLAWSDGRGYGVVGGSVEVVVAGGGK